MPPKKVKKPKPKRIPHANETPLKDKQPGHGAVERAKNQMWLSSGPSSSGSAAAQSQTSSVARPNYKATSTSTIGIGIGRGGGGGVVKKKKKATAAVVSTSTARNDVCSAGDGGRMNPDSNFFQKPL